MTSRSPFNQLAQIIRQSLQKNKLTEIEERETLRKEIAFQGDISVIALDNIFQLFDFAALSGRLDVYSTTNSGSFYFNQGVLIHATVQISRHKLGEILLDAQMITEEQLEECLRLHVQQYQNQRFGQVLLEKGYIDTAGLDDTLIRQVKEAFFEALSWNEGTFAYYHNQFPDPEVIHLQERVDHLLLEGMIYLDTAAPDQS